MKTPCSLQAADFLVVEGDVEGSRVFDQAVVADDRNAFSGSLFDGRADCVGVLGENDQGVGALRDQRFDVGQLLCGRRLGVSGNVLGALGFECLLDGSFVGLPTFFLEVGPGNADDEVGSHGSGMHGHEDGSPGHQLQNRLHNILPSGLRPAPASGSSGRRGSLSRKVRIIFSTVEKFSVRDFFNCQHCTTGLISVAETSLEMRCEQGRNARGEGRRTC